jgi:hypothetical protein
VYNGVLVSYPSLLQALKSMKKADKKKGGADPIFHFEALHMINDPQGRLRR